MILYIVGRPTDHPCSCSGEFRSFTLSPKDGIHKSTAIIKTISLSPVTFFKYNDSIKVLNEEDYEDVVNSGRLFARKIIKGKSDRLIAMLDQVMPELKT